MDLYDVPKEFVRAEFGCYTDDEIRKLSVLEITNQKTFDELGHATPFGLYDRRLGSYEKGDTCGTCSLPDLRCPGHMGHIELPIPVYHPLWLRQLELIVRGSCFSCKKLLEDSAPSEKIVCMVRLIDADLFERIDDLKAIYCKMDSISATKIIAEMREFVDKLITETEGEVKKSAKANRFINQLRAELLQEYMSTAFKSKKGHCSHCLVPVRKLRQEHQVKMFFDEGASRREMEKAKKALVMRERAALKAQKALKRRKHKKVRDSEDEGFDDETVEDDIDEEMDLGDAPDQHEIDAKELEVKMAAAGARAMLTPALLREHMRKLWDNNRHNLKVVCGMLEVPLEQKEKEAEERPTDIFFLSALPVPPSKFRPVAKRAGQAYENPTNLVYCRIMQASDEIRRSVQILKEMKLDPDEVLDGEKRHEAYDTLHKNMLEMQMGVNNILDKDMSKIDTSNKPAGVRQLIEKKQGLFRKHMMGKRVDFAARSVISPDPFIGVDEVGIPEVFAKRLTFPEPVNAHNVERLKRAVLNGPNVHPGATHVKAENGTMTMLSATNYSQREVLANTLLTADSSSRSNLPKTVCRHLRNGDMLLMNRQPTLHRPSIQAHKAHVLPKEKTIRLHYANCNAYNADFDGDEMNAHFPQSYVGQSEAREIVATKNQYLVPKSGAPLAGLIQDHVIGGVTLCMRGRLFNRSEYQQLVFSGLVNQGTRIKLLPPCIVKPVQLWSGKQVISTVVRNLMPVEKEVFYINLQGTSKITGKSWVNGPIQIPPVAMMGEETVVFRQGHLVQGVLDKNHYGASQNGLVHACYELYGGTISTQLLTSLARLFTTFLKNRGFTLGVQDIMCIPQADKKRSEIMRSAYDMGDKAVAGALGLDETEGLDDGYMAAHFDTDDVKMKEIDLSMKQVSDSIQNDITKATMPQGLLKKFPDNNLQLMVVAGAKGSTVNCMQISGLLGQIELEGRRPPITKSGRSLPSFRPYDTTPRAGGFVDGRFLSGIRPQEYFFHCMAGREGLVDTAVKTSRSGYLQRCLIKHLEGVMVEYDSTVRDSDGSIVQFTYGEDGLSVLNTNLLNRKRFPFLIANYKTAAGSHEMTRLREILDKKKAKRWDKKISKFKEMWSEFAPNDRRSAFLKYTQDQPDCMKSATESLNLELCRSQTAKAVEQSYRDLSEEERSELDIYSSKYPDPTISVYAPSRHLHSLPEQLREDLDDYKLSNTDQLLVQEEGEYGKITADQLEELVSLYGCRSRVEPGDGVGILAAQSIGEPSTQMTLNTFHFAGRGEMNVTLGIPRLRELLMVASKTQKTPFMDIPFLKTKHAIRRAKNLQLKLTTVRLSELLETADISTRLITKGPASEWGKEHVITLQFLSPDQYAGRCLLTPKLVLRHVEGTFVAAIATAYAKAMQLNQDLKLLNALTVEKDNLHQGASDGEEEDELLPAAENDELEAAIKEAGVDHDAVAGKDLERMDEEREYDGEEDEIAELLGDEISSDEPDGESAFSTDAEENSDVEDYTMDQPDSLSAKKRLKRFREAAEKQQEVDPKRIAAVVRVPGVVGYSYDVGEERWCQITFKYPLSNTEVDMTPVIESVARATLVCDPEKVVRGVSKAILTEPKCKDDPPRLKTDGVNIQRMLQYDSILDISKLYTNDIHAMAENYGIEAACRVLIKEIRDVFAAYGITVNYRHLSLIADYLTFDGKYKAFNRSGLLSHASSLQKMTYEASTMFLKQTMLAGAVDDLDSPSARIVVGRTVKVGTGSFECVTVSKGDRLVEE
ncbi:DNA-directed RNA polymerase I subunit RPA1-like [Watersipora subatra]|uniref:DNA-directed RNA polymerase I subunit RPA1-like n=1 Tax=Watersipora subatra TaxID=2589382 RepID=UPI00355C45A2